MSDLGGIAAALAAEPLLSGARVRVKGSVLQVTRGAGVVLVADAREVERTGDGGPLLAEARALRAQLVLLSDLGPAADRALLDLGVYAVQPRDVEAVTLTGVVRTALEAAWFRSRLEQRAEQIRRYRYELGELVEIARAISSERDIDSLLGTILERTRFIASADAGSIYTVEGKGPVESRSLRFKLAQNDSVSLDWSEVVMPISRRSMAGAAVLERRFINIPDAYALPEDGELHHDPTFDERSGYRTKSVLSAPMISQSEEVIGVVQLINRKADPRAILLGPDDVEELVLPFDARSEELVRALGAHAAVSLENALLYDNIRRMFEGFVTASAHAIEQRDPTTSGHSARVARLTMAMAELVNRDEGPFAEVTLSKRELLELRYAALLHDFGKIGVREELLVKAKKLHPRLLALIAQRFESARLALRCEELELRLAAQIGGEPPEVVEREQARLDGELTRLVSAFRVVVEANEAPVLDRGEVERVAELASLSYRDGHGRERPLLAEEEVEALRIRRGSLTAAELEEIRSHAGKTVEFLSRIPWGAGFSELAAIAGAHHERLDGSGYPEGRAGDGIPLQARMMSVADVFDALTASDRPYKKAVPVDRALEILRDEAERGLLDKDLVRLFEQAEVFRAVEAGDPAEPSPEGAPR